MKELESTKVNESTSPDCGKPVVGGSGLPIHGTTEDNKLTFCGLNVTKAMSYHRGGIMIGMIKNKSHICSVCLDHFR